MKSLILAFTAAMVALWAIVTGFFQSLGEAAHDGLVSFMSGAGLIAYAVTKGPAFTTSPRRTIPSDQSIYELPLPFTMPAVAPAVNDTFALCQLYPQVTVVDFKLISDQADTNGTPTASLSVGELSADYTTMPTVYATGIQTQRTGGIYRPTSAAAFLATPNTYTQGYKNIGLRFDAAFATYAANKTGLLVLALMG